MTAVVPTFDEIANGLLAARNRFYENGPAVTAATRTLYNVCAVAIGASASPQVERLAQAFAVADGAPAAPGLASAATPEHAALITGFAAHLDDFDDTHLATVIHPGAACLGAAWAAGWDCASNGPELLAAFALGCEAQLRLGVSVSPEHYDLGWHITGTCGAIGAAVTAALLQGASADSLADAMRFASVRTLGHREAFGTELKPFHAGKAAANGLAAAEASRAGLLPAVAEDLPTLGPLLRALAPATEPHAPALGHFTDSWELVTNTFKPYPCGIVAHPGIDAAVSAHEQGMTTDRIKSVLYRCNPLVPELMGNLTPADGLQARFSAVHGVAVGLVYGRGGLAEFSDTAARDPLVSRLREAVRLAPDVAFARDAARLEVTTDDGESHVFDVVHARGSEARPLTDDELIAKAAALMPSGQAEALWEAVLGLPTSDGARPLHAALPTGRAA